MTADRYKTYDLFCSFIVFFRRVKYRLCEKVPQPGPAKLSIVCWDLLH